MNSQTKANLLILGIVGIVIILISTCIVIVPEGTLSNEVKPVVEVTTVKVDEVKAVEEKEYGELAIADCIVKLIDEGKILRSKSPFQIYEDYETKDGKIKITHYRDGLCLVLFENSVIDLNMKESKIISAKLNEYETKRTIEMDKLIRLKEEEKRNKLLNQYCK